MPLLRIRWRGVVLFVVAFSALNGAVVGSDNLDQAWQQLVGVVLGGTVLFWLLMIPAVLILEAAARRVRVGAGNWALALEVIALCAGGIIAIALSQSAEAVTIARTVGNAVFAVAVWEGLSRRDTKPKAVAECAAATNSDGSRPQ
jgi:hypothetical protein